MSEAKTLDESAVGNYFSRWQRAASTNDLAAMLAMIADDAVFLVAGQAPFGKREFAEMQAGTNAFQLDFESTIGGLTIHGDLAVCWCRLAVTMTPRADAEPVLRRGHTLTVLRHESDGQWRLWRDANLLVRVDANPRESNAESHAR